MWFPNSPYYLKREGQGLIDRVVNSYDSFVDKVRFNMPVSYDSIISDLDRIRLGKPVDHAVKSTMSFFKDSNDLNKTLLWATGGSILANSGITYMGQEFSLSKDTVTDMSYWTESLVYTTVFVPVYWNESRKNGKSRIRTLTDLLFLGGTGALLSTTVYRAGRTEIINYATDTLLWPKPIASGATQMALLLPFGITLDVVRRGLDYVDNALRLKDRIVNGTELVANGVITGGKKVKAIGEVTKKKIQQQLKG